MSLPSLLARLRGDRSSRSSTTTNTAPSASALSDPTATSTSPPALTVIQESRRDFIGRSIHPDVNSLLDSYSSEVDVPQGLRPRKRKRSGGSHVSNVVGVPFTAPPRPLYENNEPDARESRESRKPESVSNATSDSISGKVNRRILSQMTLLGTHRKGWSTFGRNRKHRSPPIQDFVEGSSRHTRAASDDPGALRRSLSSKGNKNTPERTAIRSATELIKRPRASAALRLSRSLSARPGRKTEQAANQRSSRTSSPHTISSDKTSSRKSRPRSNTTPSSSSSKKSRRSLFLGIPARVVQEPRLDSPNTFGYPTPPETRVSGYNFTSDTTAPPRQPLEHSGCIAGRNSGFQSNRHIQKPRKASFTNTRNRDMTYSSRRSHSSQQVHVMGNSSVGSNLFPSTSFTFEKSLRPYSSLPKVRQVFAVSERPSISRFRSKSDGPPRKRPPGSWMTQAEFGMGDGTDSNPASGRSGNSDLTASPEPRLTRADNVPNLVGGQVSPPSSSFSANILSSSLGSPFLLQGSDVDRPLSPHDENILAEGGAGEEREKGMVVQGDRIGTTFNDGLSASSTLRWKKSTRSSAQRTPLPTASRSAGSSAGLSSLLQPPSVSVTAPTPRGSSEGTVRRSVSDPIGPRSYDGTPISEKSFGKRKAEDVDVRSAVPRHVQHASFVLPEHADRTASRHPSDVSQPPSSYQGRKRARLSSPPDSLAPSRAGSTSRGPNTGSWSSRSSRAHGQPSRAASNAASTRSSPSQTHVDRRHSISQASIPMSAIVTPHAPSISRSSNYHMRDPRRPPKIQPTPWTLRLKSQDEDRSPISSWCFFIGFLVFPMWWVASFLPIPRTREVGGTDTEKAVTLDDPQIEHDAKSWRKRCRIMSIVSFLTYIPFIILVAVFVTRKP